MHLLVYEPLLNVLQLARMWRVYREGEFPVQLSKQQGSLPHTQPPFHTLDNTPIAASKKNSKKRTHSSKSSKLNYPSQRAFTHSANCTSESLLTGQVASGHHGTGNL